MVFPIGIRSLISVFHAIYVYAHHAVTPGKASGNLVPYPAALVRSATDKYARYARIVKGVIYQLHELCFTLFFRLLPYRGIIEACFFHADFSYKVGVPDDICSE